MSEANWYVVHTYSGYENKVKTNIEQSIENRKLQDQILQKYQQLQIIYCFIVFVNRSGEIFELFGEEG